MDTLEVENKIFIESLFVHWELAQIIQFHVWPKQVWTGLVRSEPVCTGRNQSGPI